VDKHTRFTPEYWLQIVDKIAMASTCRVNIGCVLVQRNRIRGVGFLGSVTQANHCIDYGCLYVDAPHMGSEDKVESCIRTIHAETNAVLDALNNYHSYIDNLIAYSTYSPCLSCFKLMMQVGIREYFFRRTYRDDWRDKLIADSFSGWVTFSHVPEILEV